MKYSKVRKKESKTLACCARFILTTYKNSVSGKFWAVKKKKRGTTEKFWNDWLWRLFGLCPSLWRYSFPPAS